MQTLVHKYSNVRFKYVARPWFSHRLCTFSDYVSSFEWITKKEKARQILMRRSRNDTDKVRLKVTKMPRSARLNNPGPAGRHLSGLHSRT